MTTAPPTPPTRPVDPLTIGRRVRHLRTARGMTLEALAASVGRAPSQISVLENGKREPRLSLLQSVAAALGAPLSELLDAAPPSRRDSLEIALERHQRAGVFEPLGLPPVRVGRSLPTDALELIVGLQEEILRLHEERAATPEEARRANAELRRTMREQDNHFPEMEEHARRILAAIGHPGGPLSQRAAADIAAHLGFSLHYVTDLPHSTRSVTDLAHGRIYLPHQRTAGSGDPRSLLLQALSSHVLGHSEPTSYSDLLRQRVESNYLSAAMMVPEDSAVDFLTRAKAARALSIEDLRDAFAVPYETAAHRFTNLATRHLDVPVHFMKVDRAGTIHKAYENDGVRFPADALGAVEGQPVCRRWTARVVFDIPDQLSPYYQYTDTVSGTFWCTARTQTSGGQEHSVAVGVPYAHVRWFRGRETPERGSSRCPDPTCCRTPPARAASRWQGRSWANARTPASLLATLPADSCAGVDSTAVYQFLDAHAPAPARGGEGGGGAGR
ncbi:helix-turn-helix transcriptional regulator [Quadrisphaera sp. DSM 44207]|uniref:helix-turn-helix transcriptional regulator n=1 Tax=Quadrisphaera sp. DSM 44207 TaxID=1881057 RepID=UPI0008817BD6|nr:helix-turn-helix transcriptional regulator [Quadrisphaera sp. DSM 44207]SDQ19028.1 Predicted transcriptional regulator [Quadrisphaera sp. DSM 44207]